MSTPLSALPIKSESSKMLRVVLWTAQILLGVAFAAIGLMKIATPISELAVNVKWAADYSPTFVRCMGVIDLLGGIGVLLPSLTRILPRVAVLAALGCTALQFLAIAFHLSRGEANVLPLNFVLIALSIFVLWGRSEKAPIAPR